MRAKVEVAVKTDVGMVRSENQDHFSVWQPDEPEQARAKGTMIVVADGMGGHSGGTVASQTAVESIVQTYKKSEMRSMRDLLDEAISAANAAVRDKLQQDPHIHDCGTTCVCLSIRGKVAMVAHLGDSRCYLFRGETIERVTRDHTYLNELIDIGLLTVEQAKGHPDRNIITRCVGMSDKLDIDFNRRQLEPGDVLLLCSDGLTNFVTDQEMSELSREYPPAEACQRLVDLANKRGGEDNVTVAIARIDGELEQDPELAALDADDAAYSSKMTPVINRDELDPKLLAGGYDPDADTADGLQLPADYDKTREMRAPAPVRAHQVTTAQSIVGLVTIGSTTQDVAMAGNSGPARLKKLVWWILGFEILLLVVIHFLSARYQR